MLFFSQLSSICPGETLQLHKDRNIEDLIIDSRKTLLSEQAIFFAIKGERHDGHRFIPELYEQGIRQFIVEESISLNELPEANILRVKSSITALQQLASFHRSQFTIPVIAITGSNGKTIIKEWLHQLLTPDYKIVKNPGSYNSQLGVPLSVWQMQQHHELGIFEAGISKPGEMGQLQKIAHDEGFASQNQKLSEKLILFSDVEKLIYCSDQPLTHAAIQTSAIPSLSWGFNEHADEATNEYSYHSIF